MRYLVLHFSLVFSVSAAFKLGILQTDGNKTTLCDNGILFAKQDGNCASDPITLYYGTSCSGNQAQGTSGAIDLVYQQQVNAIVGPSCTDETAEIGRMAYFWQKGVFSRSVKKGEMLDSSLFPNSVSTTMASPAGLIRAVYELYKYLENRDPTNPILNISLVGPQARDINHYPLAQAVLDYLQYDPILTVGVYGVYDERGAFPSIIRDQIEANGSKVLVVATDFEYSEFLKSLEAPMWYSNGFIVILMSLDPVYVINTPGSRKEIVDSHAIIVAPYLTNVALTSNITDWDKDGITGSFATKFSIFLGCYAFCYAAKKGSVGSTTNFISDFQNMQFTMNQYGSFRFDASGSYLNDYAFYRLRTEAIPFESIIVLNTSSKGSCDNSNNKQCFNMAFTITLNDSTYFDELVSRRKSPCTLTNSCASSWFVGWMIAIAFFIALIVLCVCTRVIHRRRSFNQYRLHWKLKKEDIKIIENRASKGGVKQEQAGKKRTVANYALISNTKAEFLAFYQATKIKWQKPELKYLYELRLLNHDNLNKFVGLVCNEKDQNNTGRAPFYIISSMVEKASLEDFINDQEFGMEITFKSSFIRDVIKGLIFLHKSPIGYHGLLTAGNCMIDNYWVLKLTNFGVCNMVHELINKGTLEVAEAIPYAFYLPFAPENMQGMEITRNYPKGSSEGDVFSLGYLIFQILFRHSPYEHHGVLGRADSLQKIIKKTWTPAIIDYEDQDQAFCKVVEQCWKDAAFRPKLKDIRLCVESTFSQAKGQLVDQMLELNERYALNLEKIVEERSSLLQEAQEQTLRLLNEMLPVSVAKVLMEGGNVEPRYYDEATVLFVQIVDFQILLKQATPDQVIFFLNDIFELFDQVIARHDAYKVETTGETYMVVSGTPTPNGGKHITEIADISLEIREVSWTYRVEHDPSFKVRCKIGFHCGPIATGVIGNVAPRYCLFGDTVNFASRMQSNCPPNQIQTSEVSAIKLMERSTDYKLVQRGIVQVKGKGAVNCYWLNEHVHLDQPPPGTSHGRASISIPPIPPRPDVLLPVIQETSA